MFFMSSPEQLLLSHFIAESIGLRRKVMFSSSESYSVEEVRFKLKKKKSQTFRLLPTAHSKLKDLIHLFFCNCTFMFILFPIIFISWKLITLQYCSGFCHIFT